MLHIGSKAGRSQTLALAVAACLLAAPARAQTSRSTAASSSQFETRQQLEAQVAAADAGGRVAQAALLKARLERGDFVEGDRIVVSVFSSGRTDTMQVRAHKALQFSGMADLPLEGVLRSELEGVVRAHLARYLRNPEARATPLIPIAVLGNVGLPGFYYTSADAVLRDVIMRAGGLRDADLDRVEIRRGGDVIWKPADVRAALSNGLSVDRMHLRSGDAIYLPERRRAMGMAGMLTIISTAAAITVAATALGR